MTMFGEVVRLAQQQSGIATLQPVIEKELLHHEILRAMAQAGLLHQLTFIGGTCLRACYGSSRLSEDLDFTGGAAFSADDLRDVGAVVTRSIRETYDLSVVVSDPKRDEGNVATWKVQVLTNQGSQHLPQQRIHIDICSVASYQRQPKVLLNHYGVDLGTAGLIVQVERLEEILADKVLALALRPNRVKFRDVWDICWLTQQGLSVDGALVAQKCAERSVDSEALGALLQERSVALAALEPAFRDEMTRFIPEPQRRTSIEQDGYWVYVQDTVAACVAQVVAFQP